MTRPSNREVVLDLYESFRSGDLKPAMAVLNDDTVWEEPGQNLRSGVYRGAQEIADHITNCLDLTDGTFDTDVQEVLTGERFVVVVERLLALRNGNSLNMLVHTIYEVADGAVIALRLLPYDCDAWDAFWS